MKREDGELSRVLLLQSFAEAQVLKARLSEREIPALVRAFNDPAFGSFWRREGAGASSSPFPRTPRRYAGSMSSSIPGGRSYDRA